MNAQNNYIPAALVEPSETELLIFAAEKPQVFNSSNGMGVLQAIHAIQKAIIECGGIAKTHDTKSNNQDFKYKFRSIEDMYNVISPLMVQHGIILIPYLESGRMSKIVNKKGDISFKTVVVMRYTLYCVADASFIETTMAGESNDAGDKGTIKAQSVAQKAFFIQCFCIPTSTDTDNDRYNNESAPAYHHNNAQQEYSGNQRTGYGQANQANQPQPAQQYASNEFKKELDTFMRQNNNNLRQVLHNRGLDEKTVTYQQLMKIANEFKQFLKSQPS